MRSRVRCPSIKLRWQPAVTEDTSFKTEMESANTKQDKRSKDKECDGSDHGMVSKRDDLQGRDSYLSEGDQDSKGC